MHTHTFIRNRIESYLPLPSQPQLVLIYRPRRDERLSRPWCEVAQAEIRTCNLPITSLALYHTATNAFALLLFLVIINIIITSSSSSSSSWISNPIQSFISDNKVNMKYMNVEGAYFLYRYHVTVTWTNIYVKIENHNSTCWILCLYLTKSCLVTLVFHKSDLETAGLISFLSLIFHERRPI